ncbi:MAG: phosphatidylserine decarboxylase family protein [Bdellovibrionota bacterium]
MTRVLKNHSLPIQIEGFPYIFGGLVLALASGVLWRALEAGQGNGLPAAIATGAFSIFTAFSIWFYRCPKVNTPQDDLQAVISPACGRVLKVEEVAGGRISEPRAKKVSIFMSPFDVHVNRAPVQGVIEDIRYVKGKFFKADLDKASEENEHNWVVMKSDLGSKIAFVQIAGFVARRIVCYVSPGERLACGERYGMIRFGSRMEIVVPLDSDVLVKPGDKTVAGETKLARLKSKA